MTGITLVRLILLIFSFVCFVLGAWTNPPSDRTRLVSAGLAFLAASFIPWPL